MRSREKYFWQSVIGLVAALYLAFSVRETSNLRVLELFIRWVQSGFSNDLPPKADLMVPFFKSISYPLGVFGFIIADLLRDRRREQRGEPHRRPRRPGDHAGRDGRLGARRVRLRHRQRGLFASTCSFPYIPGAGELLIFCAAMAGAGLAFLWFNAHPAQVFMGDVGALALGGALGTIAVIMRQEIVLGDHGRRLRGRGAVGDGAGRLVQVHQEALRRGPAHPQDGAAAPPLREDAAGTRRRSWCASGSSPCCCAWSAWPP